MPVSTFPQMAGVQPGIPLDVSCQILYHNSVTFLFIKE